MKSGKADLFLSYARGDDEPFVERLYRDLTAEGFRVWWDRESMPNRGLKFTLEIRNAIDSCERLLLVVGPKAIESEYVRAEWEHALLFAKGVVPVATGVVVATFTCDGAVLCCAFADPHTVLAGDALGRLHPLELVE